MEKTNLDLLKEIQKVFKEEWFKKLIENVGKNSEMASSVSRFMGEVYIYAISMQSCDGIKEYFEKLYGKEQMGENKIKREEIILEELASKLGISKNEAETSEIVRREFLENYCAKGFVMHSFTEKSLESLSQDGIRVTKKNDKEIEKKQENNEILKIARIFENHGVIKACGTYPFYSSSGGKYVEHDPLKVYEHAVLAPEWFYEFTGSDHNNLDSKISTHPLITRDYEACKQNVEDLCVNAELSEEEKNKVMDFFERSWEIFGNSKKYVAIIPKQSIGKADYEEILTKCEDIPNSKLIGGVLKDKFGIFQEHVGNVIDMDISREEFEIMELPDSREIFKDVHYTRENKETLQPTEDYLKHIQEYAEMSHLNMENVISAIGRVTEYWEKRRNEIDQKSIENEPTQEISMKDLVKNALRADNQNVVGNEMTDKIDKEESIEQENIEDKGEQINE